MNTQPVVRPYPLGRCVTASILTLLVAAGISACGGSSSSTSNSTSASTSASASASTGKATNVALTTPPATKPIASFTWWVYYRPIISLDPIKTEDYPESMILDNMCESLLRQVPGQKIVPNLATAYRYTSPTTLKLTIRQGVEYWNGTPMKTSDVVWNLNRNRSAKAGSAYFSYLANIHSVKQTGPSTVTISLSRPDYGIPFDLSTFSGVIVSPSYAKAKGTDFGTASGGVMCTGPFTFQSWNGATSVVATRNNRYWNPALKAKSGKVTFLFNENDNSTTQGFVTGQYDGGYFVPIAGVPTLRNTDAGTLYIGPPQQAGMVGQLVPITTSRALSSPLVRQALWMVIDRPGITHSLLNGLGTPAYGFNSAAGWNEDRAGFAAAEKALAAKAGNITAAKALVAKAGAIAKKPIVISVPAGRSLSLDEIAVIQQNAKKAGLNVTIRSLGDAAFAATITDPKARAGYDAVYFEDMDTNPEGGTVLEDAALPGQSLDFGNCCSKAITAAIHKAQAIPNPGGSGRSLSEDPVHGVSLHAADQHRQPGQPDVRGEAHHRSAAGLQLHLVAVGGLLWGALSRRSSMSRGAQHACAFRPASYPSLGRPDAAVSAATSSPRWSYS